MGVAVDKTGEKQLPGAVHDMSVFRRELAAYGSDLSLFQQHIRLPDLSSGDHKTAAEQCFHGKTSSAAEGAAFFLDRSIS